MAALINIWHWGALGMFSPWMALLLVTVVAVGNLVLGYYLAHWLLLPRQATAAPTPTPIVKPKGMKSAAAQLAEEEEAALAGPRPNTFSAAQVEAGSAGLEDTAGCSLEAIADFRDVLLGNRKQLLHLDEQLRANRLNPSVDFIAQAAGVIRKTVRTFVAARETLIGQLPPSDATSVSSAAQGEMLQAADGRTLDSAATLAMLGEVQALAGSPHMAIERLLPEVERLVHSDGRMVELIEDVLLVMAREEGVLARLPAGVGRNLGQRCGLLGLASQVAKEEEQKVPEEHLSLIQFDVDGTAALNEELGPAVVERSLLSLGDLIEQLAPEDSLLARVAGQRYVLVVTLDGEQAAGVAETVRQTLEISPITAEGDSIELSVSAGVVERKPGERFELMRDRATAALNEAKQYGRNRTFLQEGDYPTPVLPPELNVTPMSLEAASLGV